MRARPSCWLALLCALTFGSGAAQAAQTDVFDRVYTPDQDSFALPVGHVGHVGRVTARGWTRNDTTQVGPCALCVGQGHIATGYAAA